jgi:hypothetical protein
MPSSRFQHCRWWLVAAALLAIVGQPARADVAPPPALGDTSTPRVARWRDELPAMLARVATVVDSGFATAERELVLRELGAIRPRQNPSRDGPVPSKWYVVQVRFRGRTTDFNLWAYWPDTSHVGFYIRSKDSLLTDAIDSTFRVERAALLAAPAGVRIWMEDPHVWNGAVPAMAVSLSVEDPKHCPGFGVENHGEWRGDTLAIHVVGVAPKDSCPVLAWRPSQMSHWRPIVPGTFQVTIDYKGDTSRFAARVTDTSLAMTTIRSTFVTADERVRWRVPSGSFVLTCSHFHRGSDAICNRLQGWAARRPGIERVTFDTTGVSPLRDHALAYRYADDGTLARMRACIATLRPTFRHSNDVELQIRPRSAPWIVDRIAAPSVAIVLPSDPSCELPSALVNPGRSFFTTYPLNCPTPTREMGRVVASVLRGSEGTPEWFRQHGTAVPTAAALAPLSGLAEAARCRLIDSTSSRHPVYLFRAGRYFVATTADAARPDLSPDGPFPVYLVWVLDSAGKVVHVPGYSSLDMFSFSRDARASARRSHLVQPRRDTAPAPMRFAAQDVRVSSTRGGEVVLQWTRPPRVPVGLALERADGPGAFASIGAAMQPSALATMDTTPLPGTSYRYRLRARLSAGDSTYSNEVSVTMPRVPTPRLAWTKQLYLRPAVYGRVLDSLTGEPVPNLYMSVKEQGVIARTDSLGRYLYSGAASGTIEVRFACPTMRALGMRIGATQRVEVSPQTDSVIDFHVRFRNCEEPPLRTWSDEFRGHYIYGFETSMFAPCVPFESFVGTAFEGIDRNYAWVNFTEAANAQAGRMWPHDMKPAQEYGPFYVRWRARVEGPARYGHMGVSMYDMKVTEVLEVRHSAPTDCQ